MTKTYHRNRLAILRHWRRIASSAAESLKSDLRRASPGGFGSGDLDELHYHIDIRDRLTTLIADTNIHLFTAPTGPSAPTENHNA